MKNFHRLTLVLQWYFFKTYVAIGGDKWPPRCISGSVPPRDKIPTAIPMFSRVSFSTVPMLTVQWFLYTEIQDGARKPEVVLFWHVWLYLKDIWVDYYVSWSANWMPLLVYDEKLLSVNPSVAVVFFKTYNSSWWHISRWRRKSTTTILNLRASNTNAVNVMCKNESTSGL